MVTRRVRCNMGKYIMCIVQNALSSRVYNVQHLYVIHITAATTAVLLVCLISNVTSSYVCNVLFILFKIYEKN